MPVERCFSPDGSAVEDRQEAGTVDLAVAGDGNLRDGTQGRQQIDAADRLVTDLTRFRVSGPAKHSRYADAAFVHRALLVAQRTGRSVRVPIRNGRTVVAREEHQRRVSQIECVQCAHQPAERVVHLRDVAVVSGLGRVVEARIEILETLRGVDRFVRLVETDVEKERLLFVARVFQPIDRFVGDQRRRVPVELADRLAVADEVIGVVMRGQRVVLGREPIVESVVGRLRLAGKIEPAVEVPFADVAGRITCVAQQRRDGDFLPAHVHRGEHGNPVVNADAVRRPSGHQPAPRGRAVGCRGVAVRQPHAFGGEPIEVGRLDDFVAVAGQIAVAEVVGQHHDDVRTVLGPPVRLGRPIRCQARHRRENKHTKQTHCSRAHRRLPFVVSGGLLRLILAALDTVRNGPVCVKQACFPRTLAASATNLELLNLTQPAENDTLTW